MEDELFFVSIKSRTCKTNGDVEDVGAGLHLTKEQFEEILAKYSSTEISRRHYNKEKRFATASKNVKEGEELLTENFSRLDNDAFEKLIVALHNWSGKILELILKKKSFRIEINYDAKALRMDTSYYTPVKKDV